MQFIELLSLMAGGTVFFAAFMEGKKLAFSELQSVWFWDWL